MLRTQVYFEPEVLEVLKDEARRRKITLARIIREKVEKGIKKKSKSKKRLNSAQFLLGIAKLGKKLNVKAASDLSQKIDEYVYQYPNR